MSLQPWELQARKARDALQRSIPKQWLLPEDKIPPVDQKNVADFPRKSGLLTERELTITEMSATALVADMGNGLLSAEEVVIAYLKRSVLGHQLVYMPGIRIAVLDRPHAEASSSSTSPRNSWPKKPLRELNSLTNIIRKPGSSLGHW